MEASREIFWNIGIIGPAILYPLGFLSMAVLIYTVYRRYSLWMIGKPDNRLDNPGKRIKNFIVTGIVEGLFHKRIFREPYPGIMHFCIFAGACLLLLGTVLDVIDHYIIHFMEGNVYLGVSFGADLGGALMIIGAILATMRRYIQKPERLNSVFDDALFLIFIYVIVLTGFFLEGFRMLSALPHGLSQPEYYSHPEWSVWSFGGYWVASLFSGLSEGARVITYSILWWFHAILSVSVIIYISWIFSKATHILISPVNVFFKTSRANGELAPINLEAAESYGVGKVENYTWKQLFDLDACTNCGRCEDRCPAHLSGKPLSPRKLVQDLKSHWLEQGDALIRAKKADKDVAGATAAVADVKENSVSMIGGIIEEDVLWSCTTCRACQEICPVYVEHIDKIIDMRRNLVLEQAKMPDTGEAILKCIETRGHSCRGTTATRTDWALGLDVKVLADDKNVDLIYWVGCAAALEDRNMKVARATAMVLKDAGVNFAILGLEEVCCGEPARRLGNEYLFQVQAAKNIELFKKYNVKKIVASCPHCFNTIKNEYPQFGGEFEVVHHSQLINELMRQGKINVDSGNNGKITYHDSCYLGRHNNIYQQPREVIRKVSGSAVIEMDNSGNNGFCCGGGGGRFWMEERIGKRISEMRIDQAIESGAGMVASACPYCLQMFEDAIKAREASETLKALDIVEIVAAALRLGK
jgi:Fe-S oxidoreductase/nitrate reductase gamma subunit